MIRFPLDILFVFTLFHGYSMANKLQVPYQHDPPNEQMLHESVPSVDEHSPWITGPQGKKYQFHIGKQSWLAAREKCLAQNSDLATITSTDELQWLLSRYKPQFPYTRERQVQIGLLLDQSGATAKDREWRWVSGQLLDPNMLRWTQGEPFDHAKGKERCALFNINEVRIDDVDCDLGAGRSYNYRFVCERTHQSHVEHESLNNPLWKKMEDILSYFGINSSGEKSNNPIPPTNQNHLNRILAEKEAVRKTKNNTGPDEQRKEETEKNTQELKPEPVEQKPQNGEDQKPDLGSPERKQQNIVPIKPEGEQKDKNPAAELHPEPVEQKKVVIHKPDLSEAGKDQNSIPIKPESDRKDQNLAVIKPEPVEGKRVADQRPQEGIDQHPAARKPEPVEEKRVAGQKPQEGIDQNSDMNTERKDQDSTLKPEVHVEQNPTPIKTELELEKDQKRTPEEKHSPEQEKTNNQKAEPEQKNPKKLSESEKANQKVIPESEHQSIPEGNGSKQTQQPEQKAQTTASEAEKTNQKLATKPEPSADGKTQHLESAPVIIEAIAPGAKNLASIESRIVEPIREQNPVDQANAKALLHGSDSFIAASLDNNRSAEIVETSGKEVEQLDQKNSAETTSKEVITVPIATKDPTDTVPNSAASEKAVPDTVATKDTVVVENPTKSDEEKKAEEKLELVDAEVKNSKAVNGPKPQLEIRDGDEFDQPKVPKQLVVSNGTEKISKGVQQQPTLVEQKPKDPNPVDPVIAVANTLERSLMGRDAAAASLVSNSTEQKPPPPPNNDATIGVVDAVPARIQHLERIIGMVQQMIGLGGAPPTLGSEAKKAEKGPITFGKKPEKPDEDSAEREEEKEKKEKEKKKGEEEKKEENRKEEQNKAEKGKEGIEEKKEKVEKEHVRKEEKEPVEEKEHVKKEESKPEKEHVRKEEKKPVEEKEHSRKEEKKPEEEKGMDKDHIKSEENNKLEERKVEAIKEEKRKDGEEKKAIESEEKAQIKDEKQEKVEEPKEKAKAVEKKSNTEKEHTEKEEKKEESNKEKATTEVIQEEKKSEEKKEHAGNEEKKLEEVKEQERKERKKEEEKKEDKKEVKKTEDSEEIKQEEKKKIDIEKEEKKIEKEEVKPEEKKKRKEDHKGEKEVTEVKQEEKKLEEEKKQEGKEEGKIEEKKEQTRKEEKQPEEEKEQGKKEEKKLEEKKHDRKEERKLEEEENKEGKEEKKLEERKEQTRKEQRKIINREEEEAKNIEGMMKEMLGFFGHGKRERAPSQEESAREAKKTNREEWKRRESEGQKVEVNRSIERGALASHEAVDQAAPKWRRRGLQFGTRVYAPPSRPAGMLVEEPPELRMLDRAANLYGDLFRMMLDPDGFGAQMVRGSPEEAEEEYYGR